MQTALTDPQPRQLQNMRNEVIRLLRTSLLPENEKKNLMTILPYLPLSRLQPIYQKLTEEEAIRNKAYAISPEEAKQFRQKVREIKKQAWREAEKENTPTPERLDKAFDQKLSQLS